MKIDFNQKQLSEALDWVETERIEQSIGLYLSNQHFAGLL